MSRDVASGAREVTFRDETRLAVAKPPSVRAALVADLADHVKALASAGDLEAARVAADAIVHLLGSDASGLVLDLKAVRVGRRR